MFIFGGYFFFFGTMPPGPPEDSLPGKFMAAFGPTGRLDGEYLVAREQLTRMLEDRIAVMPPSARAKLEFEIPAARTPDGEGGEASSPPDADAPRSAPSQRPPRQNDRRGDRGPSPQRGPQGRLENRPDNRPQREGSSPRDQQPRRDQPPRREPRPAPGPATESLAGENPAPSDAPAGVSPGRKRNRNRRGNRSCNPPPPGDSNQSSFGEGIPTSPPPPQE